MEDFVTFEIAKKLREKGFDYPCIGHYVNSQLYVAHYQNAFHSDNDESVDAPTISQVLAWLREEKKIHIQILFTCPPNEWEYITVKMTNNELSGMCATFTSYEQAALAGIEYVIDNLP